MSADLHTVVVAELDRLERLYGGDRKDGRHAALKAAVGWHEPVNDDDGQTVCISCWVHNQRLTSPCPPLIDLAMHLGVVVRDGG